MAKLRYSPPLDVEIEGTREDLASIETRVRALAELGTGAIEVVGDSTGIPTPYQFWLERLVIAVGSGPLLASVDGNRTLTLTGSPTHLDTLASYFAFLPGARDGDHTHLEHHPGDRWITDESVPIVICLRSPSN